MSTTIYQVTDWEQGTISEAEGDKSSDTRIRSVGYISVTPSTRAIYTITATDINGAALRTKIMMYDSNYNCIYDSGWIDSGTPLSDSHNASYIRIVLSYSSGNISPSALRECTLQYNDGNPWHIVDGKITNEYFIGMPDYAMTEPYPYALWRVDDEYNQGFPFTEIAPNSIDLGAFANAIKLRRISIPKSCKKIGRYSFRNTQLSSVTIARDCVYYPTSFPDGCIINFYPD